MSDTPRTDGIQNSDDSPSLQRNALLATSRELERQLGEAQAREHAWQTASELMSATIERMKPVVNIARLAAKGRGHLRDLEDVIRDYEAKEPKP